MQKRIIISILLSVFIILVSLGLVSYYHIQTSIERSYGDRLAEARIIATTVDRMLEENLNRLYDISLSDKIDLGDNDWRPEQDALRTAYQYSLFSDGVFLLDKLGNVLVTYPPREGWSVNLLGIPPVSKVITDMRPVVSNVFTLEPSKRKVLFALVPLRNRNGDVVGAAGGLIDPTSRPITGILSSVSTEGDTNIDLVDGLGTVIASNRPSGILTGIDHNRFLSRLIAEKRSTVATCHRCHSPAGNGIQQRTEDLLVFTPLDSAGWGIALRVPRKEVYAPSTALQEGFVTLGLIALATSFVLALGMSKSIVKPVQQLIRATDRIARGDLSIPVTSDTADEIGTLSRTFDDMRLKLAESLESIRSQNRLLEERVRERTRQLEEKQRSNEMLLRKIITSQEDERKRIARELHDDSLQTLSAVLMNIEMCRLHPDMVTQDKIGAMKETVTRLINEMTQVIQNLRPTVLDDLGFEAAVLWLVDRNLRERDIGCSVNLLELDEARLSPSQQISLFRIIQEATANIARHAQAENVFLAMRTDHDLFVLSVQDDGTGFDTRTVFENTLTGRGLGILGMKERAAQIGGTLTVCSAPGQGTTLSCSVPLAKEG